MSLPGEPFPRPTATDQMNPDQLKRTYAQIHPGAPVGIGIAHRKVVFYEFNQNQCTRESCLCARQRPLHPFARAGARPPKLNRRLCVCVYVELYPCIPACLCTNNKRFRRPCEWQTRLGHG